MLDVPVAVVGLVVCVPLGLWFAGVALWCLFSDVESVRAGSCEGCRARDASTLVETVTGVYALCGRCAQEVPSLFR